MSLEGHLPEFKQIGKYKIEGLISHGGMSLLYLASDPETHAPLIIKVLSPLYIKEKDVADRFLNEAHIISLADHPNIVRLVDSGQWEQGLFIAMEFVKGTSLKQVFEHQPYTLKRAMDVTLQIASAVSHLHTHGIVHGDLKPENILINEQGQVKVIDFGIAQLLTDSGLEMPLRFLGTPIYMSPELGIDRKNLSFQSDIFALGIIAYELATGKLCHGRIHIALAPTGLQKLLQKALQPKPQDRYSDMCDFIGDLTAYLKSSDFEKDKQGRDLSLEIYEKLEAIQNRLMPTDPPLWPDLKIDLAHVQAMGVCELYIDFLNLSDNKRLIFIAKSSKKGIEGLVSLCMLRMAVRALVKRGASDPVEIASLLVEHIEEDFFETGVRFALICIDTKQNSYSFCQYGLGVLIAKDKPMPLVQKNQFFTAKDTFAKGDTLLFIDEKDAALSDLQQEPAENILQKMRLKTESASKEPPLCVILMEKNWLL